MGAQKKTIWTMMLAAGVAALALTTSAGAQTHSDKLNWTLRVNATPGPIRTADVSPLPNKIAVSEILAGPTNGSPNGYFIYTRMAPGAHGPALFTLQVYHDYVVLKGKMTIQIGTDKFVVGPLTGVIIPPNTPHAVWNADTTPEAHLELITSADPSDLSRELLSMLKPARPSKVADAEHCIREIKVPQMSELSKLGDDLDHRIYTNRRIDPKVPNDWRLDTSLPGGGFPGADTHIHRFEQVYFQIEGETTVQLGLDTYTLKKDQIVIIGPGLVHTNANRTAVLERHIEASLPEPDPLDPSVHPIGVMVDIQCYVNQKWVHCPPGSNPPRATSASATNP
jgi:mannose-6-phosphate isomerase-like protein (cupin superfamily)